MTQLTRPTIVLIAVIVSSLGLIGLRGEPSQADDSKDDKDQKPDLSIRVRPRAGFSPVRVTVRGQLQGGADDYEEYYCAGVEWDWGDGTVSEFSYDCDPYEAGVSEIQRRFSSSHTYRGRGEFDVRLRLMRKKKPLVSASTSVNVRASIRDMIP